MYSLNDEQFHAVSRLPPDLRYEHLVKRAADHAEIWALQMDDGGWVLGADHDGREFLPLWPHPRYAEAMATGGWQGAVPVSIDVHEWIDSWTAKLESDSRLVGIFPVGDHGSVITPSAFADDLAAELSLME